MIEIQQNSAEAVGVQMDYVCPKHPDVRLWGALKGGAGFCRHPLHRQYVQAAGVPMPTLPDRPAKPAVKKSRRKPAAKAKALSRKPGKAKLKTAAKAV